MSTRIVLVDDHRIFLTGLTELINATEGMQVVASTADAQQARKLVRKHAPNVVFTDITMPGMDGFELAKRLVAEFPAAKIICLSMHADVQLIESMFKAGAAGYVLKDCELSELVEAIKKVTSGETFMSGSVAKVLAESFRERGIKARNKSEVDLTDREHEILIMLADGLTTKQIAGKLHLSIKTIGTYREHLMQKIGTHSIAGLTKYAIRKGLTTSD